MLSMIQFVLVLLFSPLISMKLLWQIIMRQIIIIKPQHDKARLSQLWFMNVTLDITKSIGFTRWFFCKCFWDFRQPCKVITRVNQVCLIITSTFSCFCATEKNPMHHWTETLSKTMENVLLCKFASAKLAVSNVSANTFQH